MAKLFSREEYRNDVYLNPLETNQIDLQSVSLEETIQSDATILKNASAAYNKVLKLSTSIANENYSLVTKKNYEFYNDYLKTISENLNIPVPLVRKEAVESLDEVFVNRSLALEGFISTIWEKIKEVFRTIATKVKAFFQKYFTRVGRVKNRVTNTLKVVQETTKELAASSIEKKISSIAKTFPESNVNYSVIAKYAASTFSFTQYMKDIQTAASEIAKADLIPAETIENIKEAINTQKDLAVNKAVKEEDIKEQEDAKGTLRKLAGSLGDTKELKEDKKDLKQIEVGSEIAKKKEKENRIKADKDIGEKNMPDIKEDDSEDELYINKYIDKFNKAVEDVVSKMSDVKLATGITIELNKASDIYTFDLSSPDPKEYDTLTLGTKKDLTNLLTGVQKILEENGKNTKVFVDCLADFDKTIKEIDRVIVTIDRLETGSDSLNKYKKYTGKVIRPSLIKFKDSFVQYNKLFNTSFELNLKIADGVVEYAVVSLKHFN